MLTKKAFFSSIVYLGTASIVGLGFLSFSSSPANAKMTHLPSNNETSTNNPIAQYLERDTELYEDESGIYDDETDYRQEGGLETQEEGRYEDEDQSESYGRDTELYEDESGIYDDETDYRQEGGLETQEEGLYEDEE